jgi:hypothetical protein
MKGQPAIEFLSVYSWTLIAIILFTVVASVLASAQSKQVYPPSYCYITIGLPCYGMYVMSNSLGTFSLIIFTNELGVTLNFPNNAIKINPTYLNSSYYGQCVPTNAVVGAVVSCSAAFPGFSTSLGTEMNPNFLLSYKICGSSCSGTLAVYNTSGAAEVAVSPYAAHFRNFVELASPPSFGTVSPGNGTYNYGSQVSISENTLNGHTFIGWTCAGTGCYNGSLTTNTVTLSNFIVETANFR